MAPPPATEDADTCPVTISLSARSCSCGVVPASFPLCLVGSILLAWIPFGDFGQNKLHLRTLRELVSQAGLDVAVLDREQAAGAS